MMNDTKLISYASEFRCFQYKNNGTKALASSELLVEQDSCLCTHKRTIHQKSNGDDDNKQTTSTEIVNNEKFTTVIIYSYEVVQIFASIFNDIRQELPVFRMNVHSTSTLKYILTRMQFIRVASNLRSVRSTPVYNHKSAPSPNSAISRTRYLDLLIVYFIIA